MYPCQKCMLCVFSLFYLYLARMRTSRLELIGYICLQKKINKE